MLVIQWYNAQQGLPLGYIARKLKKRSNTEVIFDLHFVVPKELSSIDSYFNKMGLKQGETFIVHSEKTAEELKTLFPGRQFHLTENGQRDKKQFNIIKLYHPVYDIFTSNPDFDVAAFKAEHGLKQHVFLFFGFIRKYKGLHNCIEAFNILNRRRDDVSLLICGESFWQTLDKKKLSTKIKNGLFAIAKSIFLRKEDDDKNYRPLELIDKYGLKDKVMLVNDFIPNEAVHQYFQVSDAALLFYEIASPSGIESMCYNFKTPILATAVAPFTENVKNGINGYLAAAGDIESMADVMEQIIEQPIDKNNLTEISKKMNWKNYVLAILNNK